MSHQQQLTSAEAGLPIDISGGPLFENHHQFRTGQGEIQHHELAWSRQSLAEVLNNAIATLSQYGRNATAFISVPFTPSTPITMMVPETVLSGICSTAGQHPANTEDIATSFEVRSQRSPKAWCDAVDQAKARIGSSDLEKVVLAREVVIEASQPFSLSATMANLRHNYPNAYRFSIDGLVGASPELLIDKHGTQVTSRPMAGTLARRGDSHSDTNAAATLANSAKDQGEHSYLSRFVIETLAQYCSHIEAPDVPEVLALTNVFHLTTPVSGTLKNTDITVADLLAKLHPTPAVAGWPTASALAAIDDLEELDRGRYSGAVGWLNAEGDGCFAIALRCAQINGSTAHLYAGNGIVADSDPTRELLETQWKLQPMLNALLRL